MTIQFISRYLSGQLRSPHRNTMENKKKKHQDHNADLVKCKFPHRGINKGLHLLLLLNPNQNRNEICSRTVPVKVSRLITSTQRLGTRAQKPETRMREQVPETKQEPETIFLLIDWNRSGRKVADRQQKQFWVSHPATWFSQPYAEPVGLVAVVLHQLSQRCKDLWRRHIVAAVLSLPQLVVLDHPIVQHWRDKVSGRTSGTVNAAWEFWLCAEGWVVEWQDVGKRQHPLLLPVSSLCSLCLRSIADEEFQCFLDV